MTEDECKQLFSLLHKATRSHLFPIQAEEYDWLVTAKLAASRALIHVFGWEYERVEALEEELDAGR